MNDADKQPKKLQGWHMEEPVIEQSTSETKMDSNQGELQEASIIPKSNYAKNFFFSGVWFIGAIISAVIIYSESFRESGLGFALAWMTLGTILLVPFAAGLVSLILLVVAMFQWRETDQK